MVRVMIIVCIACMSRCYAPIDEGGPGPYDKQGGPYAPINKGWHYPIPERSMSEVEDQHERQYLDGRLRHHIQDYFREQYSNKYNNVDVQVLNGVVTLRGTVHTEEDWLELEDAIRSMDGVVDVSNKVTIEVQLE